MHNQQQHKLEDGISRCKVDDGLQWEDYHAPMDLKEGLELISNRIDLDWQQNRLDLERSTRKKADDYSGRPILLLHGPPGTGKTHAMRMLAAKSRLTAFEIRIRAIINASDPTGLWKRVLEFIRTKEDAIFFVDECEGFFQDRNALLSYGNCMAQTKVEIMTEFLAWCEGIQKPDKNTAKRSIICMSTNKFEEIDEAVRSRSSCIEVPLPNEQELFQYWNQNATHLSECEQRQLAALSSGCSFRDVKKIVEERLNLAACKVNKVERSHETTFAKYGWQLKKFKGLHLFGTDVQDLSPNELILQADHLSGEQLASVGWPQTLREHKPSPADTASLRAFLDEVVLPQLGRLWQSDRMKTEKIEQLEKKVKFLEEVVEEEWCKVDNLQGVEAKRAELASASTASGSASSLASSLVKKLR